MKAEARVYSNRTRSAVDRRKHQADLAEIFNGTDNTAIEGIKRGLRVIQPVDHSHNTTIDTDTQRKNLHKYIMKSLPVLTTFDIRCAEWNSFQLEVRRKEATTNVQAMVALIKDLVGAGCFVLVENHWGNDFWEIPEILELVNDSDFHCGRGTVGVLSNSRGAVGVLSNSLEVFNSVLKRVSDKAHGPGTAIIDGLVELLQNLGDERFATAPDPDDHLYKWQNSCAGWLAAGE